MCKVGTVLYVVKNYDDDSVMAMRSRFGRKGRFIKKRSTRKSARRSGKAKRSTRKSARRSGKAKRSTAKMALICKDAKRFQRKHGGEYTWGWHDPNGRFHRFLSQEESRMFTKCRKTVKRSGKAKRSARKSTRRSGKAKRSARKSARRRSRSRR